MIKFSEISSCHPPLPQEHPPHRQEDYIKALLAADREMGGRVLETRVALYERWQSKASMGAVLEDMKGANLKQASQGGEERRLFNIFSFIFFVLFIAPF